MSARKFKFVSPGVFLQEIDNSQIPRLPGPVGPVIIGRTRKGPSMRAVRVDSFRDYVNIFGETVPGNEADDVWRYPGIQATTYAPYAAQAYLNSQTPVTMIRLAGVVGDNASAAAPDAYPGWDLGQGSNGTPHGIFVMPSASIGTDIVESSLVGIIYSTTGSLSVGIKGTDPAGVAFNSSTTAADKGKTAAITSDKFNLYFSESVNGTLMEKEVSFVRGSSYVRDVLNTNPIKTTTRISSVVSGTLSNKYWLGETFEEEYARMKRLHPNLRVGVLSLGTAKQPMGDFKSANHAASAARTGWVFPQHFGEKSTFAPATRAEKLFRIIALSEGEEVSRDLIIEIRDIKIPSDGALNPYGSFAVVVKKITPSEIITIERFDSCNLNPNSSNFLAKKVGDQYLKWDSVEKRNKLYGSNPNRSQYIRVEMHPDIAEDGPSNVASVPFGFFGPIVPASTTIDGPTDVHKAVGVLTSSINNDANDGFKITVPAAAGGTGRSVEILFKDQETTPGLPGVNIIHINANHVQNTSSFANIQAVALAINGLGNVSGSEDAGGQHRIVYGKLHSASAGHITGSDDAKDSDSGLRRDGVLGVHAYVTTTDDGIDTGTEHRITLVATDFLTSGLTETGITLSGAVGSNIALVKDRSFTFPTVTHKNAGPAAGTAFFNGILSSSHGLAGDGGMRTDALTRAQIAGAFSSSAGIASSFGRMKINWPKSPLVEKLDNATEYVLGSTVYKKDASAGFGLENSTINEGWLDYHRRLPTWQTVHDNQTSGLTDSFASYAYTFSLDDTVVSVEGDLSADLSEANITSITSITGSHIKGTAYTSADSGGSPRVLLRDVVDGFRMPLAGGFDGVDITEADPFNMDVITSESSTANNYAYASIDRAIEMIRDPEAIEMNLAALPGITNASLTTKLIETCEARADTLAIIDLPDVYIPPSQRSCNSFEDRLPTAGRPKKAAETLTARQLNSSYGATYYPWVKIRDTIYSRDVWVPPSVIALGVMAFSEKRENAVWFAPAGFNRGGLNEGNAGLPVLQVSTQLLSKQRDTLYEANINPIASFVTEGLVVFGQKTLQSTQSALDRINVRRLLIFIKREVSRISSNLLFDQNVPATWNRFKSQVVPFLEGVKTQLGLSDFRVILDESTTTPDLVDRNILYAKIFLKPARAIEFIAVDFVITRTGASFDD